MLLDRERAVALLKELASSNVVDVQMVSIQPKDNQIVIKGDINRTLIESIVAEYKLALKEDKGRGLTIIYEP